MSGNNSFMPLGLASAGLAAYTSGLIYSLSAVAIPTVLESRSESTRLTQWLSTYSRGKAAFPMFAVAASLCSWTTAGLLRSRVSQMTPKMWLFVVAGVLDVSIAPFTILVGDKINDQLKAKEKKVRAKSEGDDRATSETESLIQGWGKFNTVRSLMLLAGAILAGIAVYL